MMPDNDTVQALDRTFIVTTRKVGMIRLRVTDDGRPIISQLKDLTYGDVIVTVVEIPNAYEAFTWTGS